MRAGAGASWRKIRFASLIALLIVPSLLVERAPLFASEQTENVQQRPIVPTTVTAYDLATRRELEYRRHITPVIAGHSVRNWAVLSGLDDKLGAWINPFVEASRISATISNSFPIGDQKPTQRVDELVRECARVLGLKKPAVFVRNSSYTAAYVTQVERRPMLTLTSGLLNLYEGRPDELRFVVGRELGRIKCGHIEQWVKAYAIFVALHSVNLAVVPDDYQLVLPTLALGRLLSGFREMEFSADRAGLLCCQDLDVAFQAMLRHLHGLKAESTWIDPDSPDFDPQEYLRAIDYWEHKPLVAFIQEVKRYSSESPFVPERIAELAAWVQSGAYEEILGRPDSPTGPNPDQLVTVRAITIRNVADRAGEVNPYVVAYVGDVKWFQTRFASKRKTVRWTGIDKTRALVDGQPIFFEIWSKNWLGDSLLGGFVVYAKLPASAEDGGPAATGPAAAEKQRAKSSRSTEAATRRQALQSSIRWDWSERVTTSRQGLATVDLEYSTRTRGNK